MHLMHFKMRFPVHQACYIGDKKLVKQFTRTLAPRLLERKNLSGKTPLMIAVICNNIDCARVLLKAGVFVDNFDIKGRTALHLASMKGYHRCVKLLLYYKASYDLRDFSGNTPFHFAAISENLKCLKAFLKKLKRVQIDIQDCSKRTALHWCSAYVLPRHIKMLLAKGANVGIPDNNGQTPLHWAAANPHSRAIDCVKVLVVQQRTLINWQDYEGRSPLHLAVATGSIQVVNLLASKHTCYIDIYDNKFRTPLHWAASKNLYEKADILLERGLDVHTMPDNYGGTPLHYAAYYDHTKVLEVFFSRKYIDDTDDFGGRNCFMWAAATGSDNVIDIMIKRGTNLNVVDKEGMTALHVAAANNNVSTIKLLVKHNVPIDSKNNEEELTPLMRACGLGRLKAALLLVELGANMEAVDINFRSALHWCAIGGFAYLTQLLLLKGISCNIKDDFGRTPLHYACMKKNSLNLVSVLLESGAEVNIIDDEGRLPLHYAILIDHDGIVKLLCKYEAEVNVLKLCQDWMTPLDMAVMKGNPKIVTELQSYGGLRIREIKEFAAQKIQKWYWYNRDMKIKYFQRKRETYKNVRILTPVKPSKIPMSTNQNSKPLNRIHYKFSQIYVPSKEKCEMDTEQAANIIQRAWKSHCKKAKYSKMQETIKGAFITSEERLIAEVLWEKELQSFSKKL